MAFDTADRSRDPSRIEPSRQASAGAPLKAFRSDATTPWRRCRPAAWAPLAGGWPRPIFAQVQSCGEDPPPKRATGSRKRR
jgi:hypothetical protein